MPKLEKQLVGKTETVGTVWQSDYGNYLPNTVGERDTLKFTEGRFNIFGGKQIPPDVLGSAKGSHQQKPSHSIRGLRLREGKS